MSNVPIKCYVPIKVGFKNFDVSWLTVPRLTSIFHLSSPKRKIENSKIGSSLICLNDSIVGLSDVQLRLCSESAQCEVIQSI